MNTSSSYERVNQSTARPISATARAITPAAPKITSAVTTSPSSSFDVAIATLCKGLRNYLQKHPP